MGVCVYLFLTIYITYNVLGPIILHCEHLTKNVECFIFFFVVGWLVDFPLNVLYSLHVYFAEIRLDTDLRLES